MNPIDPLMGEHRLIERMVAVLDAQLRQMRERSKVDVDFIAVAVDFFRTYADRTHHGKEEDILFRKLSKKQLSRAHQSVMNELVEDHVFGRKTVARLVNARESYTRGTPESLSDILDCIQELVRFYPAHIKIEDKHFFLPCLEYFSQQEQDDMLREFFEFDSKLIHEKYQRTIEEIEKSKG